MRANRIQPARPLDLTAGQLVLSLLVNTLYRAGNSTLSTFICFIFRPCFCPCPEEVAKQFLQCQERLLQEPRQSPWRRYGVTDSTRTLGLLGNKESDLCLVDFRPVEDTSQKAEQFDRLQLPGLNYVIRKLSLNILLIFLFLDCLPGGLDVGKKYPSPPSLFRVCVCVCVCVRACVFIYPCK